jgi:predicted phage terminase large subunit-like protein
MEWRPNPGQQEKFHRSPAFEVLYGGQAGGGKTESLLTEALRYADVPGYTGVLFRRTFRELQQPQGLIERSRAAYPALGGHYNETKFQWRFPAGALVIFSHMEGEKDKLKHQSAEYAYIGFDELTTFTEGQYLYLFSRARTTCGVPSRIRAGTNPGNIGHEWVKRRWGAWLDKRHPNPAKDGEIRWYKREGDSDVECAQDDPEGLSRTFIRASVWDNPYIIETDPGYVQRLKALPLVERLQLLEGDWDVMAAAGLVFKREWFGIVAAAPAQCDTVRFWDFAATEKQTTKEDPDYTAGAKVSLCGKVYFIEHVVRRQATWAGAKALMAQTAELDGKGVTIGIEQEPGASGKAIVYEIASMPELRGYTVRGYRSAKDKVKRASPWSAQAEVGNVKIVNDGTWDVQAFLNECEWFPEGVHDDQVDAVSGAVQMFVPEEREMVVVYEEPVRIGPKI